MNSVKNRFFNFNAKAEDWQVLLAFLALGLILYGNTLSHSYALDDDVVFLKNKFVQSGFSGIGNILSSGFITGFNGTNDQSYRPLVLISFAIEHQLFGNTPFVGHLINVLLYAMCGFLVKQTTTRLFPNLHASLPWAMALLFMAHPIHTEVVANIKGRDDILHFLFFLGAINFLLCYTIETKRKWLILSGLFYFFALLCKEMAVTLVAIVPITLWTFSHFRWKDIAIKSSIYFGILGLYLVIRSMVLDEFTFDEDVQIINNGLAAAPDELSRISTALFTLLLYLKLLILPHPLSWDYSFEQIPIVGLGDWQTWLTILLLVVTAFYAIKGMLKKDPVAWCILFFFLSISIVSNVFIMLGATMAERFLFTPSLAFAILVPLIIARITKANVTVKSLIAPKKVIRPVIVISILLGIKTISQNMVWKNNETLYEAGVIVAPNSTRTWAALGTNYRIKGEKSGFPSERVSFFQQAIAAYQKSVEILDTNFESWYNMGVTYNSLGAIEEGFSAFKKVVSINPKYSLAWNNLGVYYFNKGMVNDAENSFQKAYENSPDNADVLSNIGLIAFNKNDYPTAINWFLKAVNMNPDNRNATKNLALAYRNNGQPDRAIIYETRLQNMR